MYKQSNKPIENIISDHIKRPPLYFLLSDKNSNIAFEFLSNSSINVWFLVSDVNILGGFHIVNKFMDDGRWQILAQPLFSRSFQALTVIEAKKGAEQSP